jgi:hypothetical protein
MHQNQLHVKLLTSSLKKRFVLVRVNRKRPNLKNEASASFFVSVSLFFSFIVQPLVLASFVKKT